MKTLSIILLLGSLLSLQNGKVDSLKLNKILDSDEFHITRTQTGGYIWVHDSISFYRRGSFLEATFNQVSPANIGNNIPNRNLDSIEFSKIKSLLISSSNKKIKSKCSDNFITVFNRTDTVNVIDPNCKYLLISQIRDIIKGN